MQPSPALKFFATITVLTRPQHCGIATLFQEMLHYNKPKVSQGHKEGKKNLLQNVHKHTYKHVHFLFSIIQDSVRYLL